MNISISNKIGYHHAADSSNLVSHVASKTKDKTSKIFSIVLGGIDHLRRGDAYLALVKFIDDNDLKELYEEVEHTGGIHEDGKTFAKYGKTTKYVNQDELAIIEITESVSSGNVPVLMNVGIATNDEAFCDAFREIMVPFLRVEIPFVPKTTMQPRIFMLMATRQGLELIPYLLAPKLVDPLYYKEGTLARVMSALEQDKSGLVFLEGIPGTGKTNLVYHAAASMAKQFIFVPHSQLVLLGRPEFSHELFSLLSNTIVVLEDSEGLFKSRDINGGLDGLSSTLLNLTDGFLGELTKLKIIATQNTTVDIDAAFLRKGRLLCREAFEKLPVEQAKAIAVKIGVTEEGINSITESITLGDIFALKPEEEAPVITQNTLTYSEIVEHIATAFKFEEEVEERDEVVAE